MTFRSTEGERITYAVDPCAMAVSQNGKMGYLLDIVNDPATISDRNTGAFDKTQRPRCANMHDAIIYEMHARDFTINKAWGGNPAYAGKYLGIIHVHLLPTYDFGSVDETKDGRNWGYDPVNYNVPEGSYSADSADPATRIREFRQMVMRLHDHGIGVILNQVYNHMYSAKNMDAIVPGYYFRSWADGAAQTTPPDTVPNEDTQIIHPANPTHPGEVTEPSEKPTVTPPQPTDPPTEPSSPMETTAPDAGVELPPLPIE